MKYTEQEVLQYVQEDDVKFIRLAFCDVYGTQKNIAIMASELQRAFEYGIAIDASSIPGFGDESHSDLLLHPDPDTIMALPWRPEHGKVVRMFTTISDPSGKVFPCDSRTLLKKAIQEAEEAGIHFRFGAEQEFYLFKVDDNGCATREPYDYAGYMDIAPEDKGENVRREICLILEQMGIFPESSHHESGPGQNEIDFRYSDPLTAADNVLTFQSVVRTVAGRNGLHADFSPKPLENQPGNGFHINVSVQSDNGKDMLPQVVAGMLAFASEMTAFFNPTTSSYTRFGKDRAPYYISWSTENRSQLVRIPASLESGRRAELRSPDPSANPYLAFALIIYAGLEGIHRVMDLPEKADYNLFQAPEEVLKRFKKLPASLRDACEIAQKSAFIRKHIPKEIFDIYCHQYI